MFEILWALLFAAARFLALDPTWCEAANAVSKRHEQSALPFTAVREPVVDAAMAGNDVVVIGGLDSERRVLRSTPRGGTEVLMPATTRPALGGEYLYARGTRWWYGLAGVRDGVRATYFVSDDGSSSMVPASGLHTYLWLPLKSDTPRALDLSASESNASLATEVNADGTVRSWHLPLAFGRLSSAELLPDGRIAVVTHHKDSKRLTLLLLGDDDEIDIISLGYQMAIQLATSIDSSGRLAIAISTTDRRVNGAVIDPMHASEPTWRELRHGIRLSAWTGDLQVTPVSDGFVVAWINRSESPPRLEAANLNADHAGKAVFTIGPVLDRQRDTCFSLRSEGDEPIVTWDDGDRIVTRRLPASIDGYEMVERLSALYCH